MSSLPPPRPIPALELFTPSGASFLTTLIEDPEAHVLGVGNNGIVRKAVWRRADLPGHSVPVAVKTLKLGVLEGITPEMVARYRREAALQADLCHPHIAELFGMGDFPLGPTPALHFVMELGAGGLDALVKPGGDLHRESATLPLGSPARLAKVAHLGAQAALGLLQAHARLYAHCDVKLANLVVNSTGQLLVTDLGLAFRVRQAGHSLAPGGTLGVNAFLGSPTYLPPENFEHCEGLTGQPPGDVYALAFALLELAQGELLPQKPSHADFLAPLPPPGHALGALGIPCLGSNRRPSLPAAMDPQLSALIKACWAADPRTRPPMAEVARRLLHMHKDATEAAAAAAVAAATAAAAVAAAAAASTFTRRLVPLEALQLGQTIAEGGSSECVAAWHAVTGEQWAGRLHNDLHGSTVQQKAAKQLAAEDACQAWACPSLLACTATSGQGARTVLLHQPYDCTLAVHFKGRAGASAAPPADAASAGAASAGAPAGASADTLQLLAAVRTAVRHLLVALHYLHSRGLCHGEVSVQSAVAAGSRVLLAGLESVHPVSGCGGGGGIGVGGGGGAGVVGGVGGSSSSSSSSASTSVDAEYDLVATGYVMVQLLTGQLDSSTYPGSSEDKRRVKESLSQHQTPRAHSDLTTAALAVCAAAEAQEQALGVSPTSHALLSSLLRRGEAAEGAAAAAVAAAAAAAVQQLVASAGQGWQLLARSPSLPDPMPGSTALRSTHSGGANAIFLDKHLVKAGDYASCLTGFHLYRGDKEGGRAAHGERVAFDHWSTRVGPPSALSSVIACHLSVPTQELLKDKACLRDLNGLFVHVPDAPGVFLKGFQVVRQGPGSSSSSRHLRIAFWSLTVPVPASSSAAAEAPVEEHATPWNDAGDNELRDPGGNLHYLDRHEVKAPAGQGLKGFVLQMREMVKPAPGSAAGAEWVEGAFAGEPDAARRRLHMRFVFWTQRHGYTG